MKRKIIFSLIAIVLVSTLTILCFVFRKDSKIFEIKQVTNGGVPYTWEYTIEDNSIISYVETVTEEKDVDLDGGIVYKYFKFKTMSTGETTITFNYVSSNDDSISESIKYIIKVDKNLNATIKKVES